MNSSNFLIRRVYTVLLLCVISMPVLAANRTLPADTRIDAITLVLPDCDDFRNNSSLWEEKTYLAESFCKSFGPALETALTEKSIVYDVVRLKVDEYEAAMADRRNIIGLHRDESRAQIKDVSRLQPFATRPYMLVMIPVKNPSGSDRVEESAGPNMIRSYLRYYAYLEGAIAIYRVSDWKLLGYDARTRYLSGSTPQYLDPSHAPALTEFLVPYVTNTLEKRCHKAPRSFLHYFKRFCEDRFAFY